MVAERRGAAARGAGHELVDVGRLRLQRLLAREGEQLPGELGRALDGPADLLERAAHGRASASFLLQHFDVAEDDHEDVVEVVRDAAGELADRFHLLRLAQLLLGQPPRLLGALRSVTSMASNRAAVWPSNLDGARGHLDLDDRPVLLAVPHPVPVKVPLPAFRCAATLDPCAAGISSGG